jgi:hypothetical protein
VSIIDWLQALNRTAAALEALHGDAERYMDAAGIARPVDPKEVERHAAEPAVGESREEWEIAIDEERAARRAAENREEIPL